MTDNKENLKEIPIPDVITRVGIENLGKRVRKLISKKGLKCTDKQLHKLFIEGLIMFIICSTGLALLFAFQPTNWASGFGFWALQVAICIALVIVGFMIILAYKLRHEEFKRFLTKRRIKLAEGEAEIIEMKMKKK